MKISRACEYLGVDSWENQKKTLKRDECLMLKKGKKTHQSPSSKTKADEERKNWLGFYFFSDCEYRGLEFWGW